MRIVVTGAAGFIGSHVAEALIAEGHEVIGVDAFIDYYPRTRKEQNLALLRRTKRFVFHELDLSTDSLEPILAGADAVIHEAAMPGLPQSWTRFEAYVNSNLIAMRRLLEAAVVVGLPRLVHVSTSSVYGATALGDESSATQPISPYGITKLAGEHLVHAYARAFGLPAIVLRYFSVYGPRQRPDMAYGIFMRALLEERPITVFGDGSASRTSTYVTDCVRATVLALHSARVGETYNVGGGAPITVLEVIRHLADLIGVKPQLVHASPRPGDQVETRAVIDKARRELGYEPSVTPFEGLACQLEWERAAYAVG